MNESPLENIAVYATDVNISLVACKLRQKIPYSSETVQN